MYQIENMTGKNVLITDGTGFIGSNLAEKCIELGANVEIFTKSAEKINNLRKIKNNVCLTQGDIWNYPEIESAILGKDVVFHLAAQTSHFVSMENPVLDVEINLVGTMNVLEACRRINKNCKIISVGTVSQSGIAKMLPISESTIDWPIELYSANKLICEKYMQIYHKAHGLKTCFLRLGTIYGDGQQLDNPRRGITNFFIGRISRNGPITIYGDGKFKRDYVYVGDVVDALILAAQNEKAIGESFLLGGEIMYFVDMVKNVIESANKILNKEAAVKFVDFPKDEKKIDVGDTEIDFNKITKFLGWIPKTKFKDGIEKTIKSYGGKP